MGVVIPIVRVRHRAEGWEPRTVTTRSTVASQAYPAVALW